MNCAGKVERNCSARPLLSSSAFRPALVVFFCFFFHSSPSALFFSAPRPVLFCFSPLFRRPHPKRPSALCVLFFCPVFSTPREERAAPRGADRPFPLLALRNPSLPAPRSSQPVRPPLLPSVSFFSRGFAARSPLRSAFVRRCAIPDASRPPPHRSPPLCSRPLCSKHCPFPVGTLSAHARSARSSSCKVVNTPPGRRVARRTPARDAPAARCRASPPLQLGNRTPPSIPPPHCRSAPSSSALLLRLSRQPSPIAEPNFVRRANAADLRAAPRRTRREPCGTEILARGAVRAAQTAPTPTPAGRARPPRGVGKPPHPRSARLALRFGANCESDRFPMRSAVDAAPRVRSAGRAQSPAPRSPRESPRLGGAQLPVATERDRAGRGPSPRPPARPLRARLAPPSPPGPAPPTRSALPHPGPRPPRSALRAPPRRAPLRAPPPPLAARASPPARPPLSLVRLTRRPSRIARTLGRPRVPVARPRFGSRALGVASHDPFASRCPRGRSPTAREQPRRPPSPARALGARASRRSRRGAHLRASRAIGRPRGRSEGAFGGGSAHRASRPPRVSLRGARMSATAA